MKTNILCMTAFSLLASSFASNDAYAQAGNDGIKFELPPVVAKEKLEIDPGHDIGIKKLPAIKVAPKDFIVKTDCTPDYVLPRNPTFEQIECKFHAETRCGSRLSPEDCRAVNAEAGKRNLVTAQVAEKSSKAGICIINSPYSSEILAVCPQGCFEANTNILVGTNNDTFKEVAAKNVKTTDRLAALDKESSLDAPVLVQKEITKVTNGPEEEKLYRFELDNGRTLAVTRYHGMVLSDGRVVYAEDVALDDQFLDSNGREISIESIDRVATNTDVYNFNLDVATPQEHVMVAEDILIGDIYWQSPASTEAYSKKLR